MKDVLLQQTLHQCWFVSCIAAADTPSVLICPMQTRLYCCSRHSVSADLSAVLLQQTLRHCWFVQCRRGCIAAADTSSLLICQLYCCSRHFVIADLSNADEAVLLQQELHHCWFVQCRRGCIAAADTSSLLICPVQTRLYCCSRHSVSADLSDADLAVLLQQTLRQCWFVWCRLGCIAAADTPSVLICQMQTRLYCCSRHSVSADLSDAD